MTRIVNSQTKSVFDSTSVMATTKSAAAESKKRKRELDVDDLIQVFDTEPDDYKIAWNEFKHRFIELIELIEHSRQTIPSVNFSFFTTVVSLILQGLTLIACTIDSLSF